MTTKTFPRTMNDAFPGGADYACALYIHKKCVNGLAVSLIGAFCLIAGTLLMLAVL